MDLPRQFTVDEEKTASLREDIAHQELWEKHRNNDANKVEKYLPKAKNKGKKVLPSYRKPNRWNELLVMRKKELAKREFLQQLVTRAVTVIAAGYDRQGKEERYEILVLPAKKGQKIPEGPWVDLEGTLPEEDFLISFDGRLWEIGSPQNMDIMTAAYCGRQCPFGGGICPTYQRAITPPKEGGAYNLTGWIYD